MSPTGGSCEFVIDSSDSDMWNAETKQDCYIGDALLADDGRWHCPHDAADGEYLCLFHLPVDRKDDDAVVDAFVRSIENGPTPRETADDGTRVHQFAGAIFGTFELCDHAGELESDAEILLSHAEFHGPVDLSGRSLSVPFLSFRGATFRGACSFERSTFDTSTNFSDAVFEVAAGFEGARFEDDVYFTDADFRDEATFDAATFEGETHFAETSVEAAATFRNATFRGRAKCSWAEFGGPARFSSTVFEGENTFMGVTFGAKADFKRATFRDGAHFRQATFAETGDFSLATLASDSFFYAATFDGVARFQVTRFEGRAVFRDATFADEADFEKARFGLRPEFDDAGFQGVASFTSASLPEGSFTDAQAGGVCFEQANLQAADFDGADLTYANFERARLSSANLSGANLSGSALAGTRIDGVVVDTETVFDRHQTNRCLYDPDSEYRYERDGETDAERLRKAMDAYEALGRIAGENALPSKQAAFHSQRRRMHRVRLRREESFPRLGFRRAQLAHLIPGTETDVTRVLFLLAGTTAWVVLLHLLVG
ncbi:pentapeptide repeat-containing protein [Haloarchaeobius sp. DYHT-AS-18]|uniref:pentapeptide repeat-containing protein n=1 Tax=Haloarchaeobius sp. DYHT-AS-18 TaxID=3446117 RepID=UPI003EBC4CA7